tara:strand:+ start:213 stop:782 length:570 start_codon:yes stop_codon:yes gene_type:complete
MEDKNILSQAIQKQSRLLMDIEVIDACDIMMGDEGFTAVPEDIIGKRRIDIGMENRPRRWYGLLSQLNQEEKQKATQKETRPWGKYEILLDDVSCKVKKITVNPKSRLSYQSHEKRAEVWVVISGYGKITCDGETDEITPAAIVMIPYGMKHRIENTDQTKNLVFIETQIGTYFGEDDITRYEDDYGRE